MQTVNDIIPKLKEIDPSIKFAEGDTFMWSSSKKTIFYADKYSDTQQGVWSLVHEFAHATLNHHNYKSDFELIQLESQAWQKAKEIALNLNIKIPDDHIENCLDTYRDWLHRRGVCPECTVVSLQQADRSYKCINCHTRWKVPNSTLCQPRRTKLK